MSSKYEGKGLESPALAESPVSESPSLRSWGPDPESFSLGTGERKRLPANPAAQPGYSRGGLGGGGGRPSTVSRREGKTFQPAGGRSQRESKLSAYQRLVKAGGFQPRGPRSKSRSRSPTQQAKYRARMERYMKGGKSEFMEKLFASPPRGVHRFSGDVKECLPGMQDPWQAYMSCGTTKTGLGQLALAAVAGSPAFQAALAKAEEGKFSSIEELLQDVFRNMAIPSTTDDWNQLWTRGQANRERRVPKKYREGGV